MQYVQFCSLTPEQWKKLAVCEVCVPLSSGGDLSHRNTLFDKRMGVLNEGEVCETCNNDSINCPGHFGYISLDVPVCNRVALPYIVKILQCICPYCSQPKIKPEIAEIQGLINKKGVKRFKALVNLLKGIDRCPYNCPKGIPGYFIDGDDVRMCPTGNISQGEKKKLSVVIDSSEIYRIFTKMNEETITFLGFNSSLGDNPDLYKDGEHVHFIHPTSLFYINLPVIPPPSRPFVVIGGEQREDHLTEMYNGIIKINERLKAEKTGEKPKRRRGASTQYDRQNDALELTQKVWALVDNSKKYSKLSSGGKPHKDISVRIKGKGGRVQGNIGAVRVENSGRAVITSGALLIPAGYIGIPISMCDKLTKNELVENWNIEYLQSLVDNGQVLSVFVNGREHNISSIKHKGRFLLKRRNIVCRILQNDDEVAFNRQPTLRLESFRSFKVLRIPGDTIRFSAFETGPFNADFDGDEMNIHVVQSTLATAEARHLLCTSTQIVTPQSNSCIAGNVQDSLSTSYIITNRWKNGEETMIPKDVAYHVYRSVGLEWRATFLNAEKYYEEFVKEGEIISNTIPGKLFISPLFPLDFNYTRFTDTNEDYPKFIVVNGVIIPESGPICKKIIGASGQTIQHILWKEYGKKRSLRFFGEIEFLCYNWLPFHGFSVGIEDCLIDDPSIVAESLEETREEIDSIVNTTGDERVRELKIANVLSSAMNIGPKLAKGGMKGGDRNSLFIMSISGAKGKSVNSGQMSAWVGQQDIDGGRVPLFLSEGTRSLPHFKKGDNGLEARGFVSKSYLDGLLPNHQFFHGIAGREGMTSTSLKTAKTGYIQKRIARILEDLTVNIDQTVRTTSGNIVQFIYGDDGMDGAKIYSVSGVDYPFPVNPSSIAERLSGDKDDVRCLMEEEIEYILSQISSTVPGIDTDITRKCTENTRNIFRPLLEKVKISQSNIPEFCKRLIDNYETSKVCYGEPVGSIATHSLAEKVTQMTLDSFHSTGSSSMNISLGVPRLDELLRVSMKVATPSMTISFQDQRLNEKRDLIRKLKSEEETLENRETLERLNSERVEIVNDFCKNIYYLELGTLLERTILFHSLEDYDVEIHSSPISMTEYSKYEKSWWAKLKTDEEPDGWVITLIFNKEKIYREKLTLERIREKIVDVLGEDAIVICSPDNLLTIDVYPDFSKITDYVSSNISLKDNDKLLTEENTPFYTARDVVVDLLKGIQISGIKGVVKTYPREDKKRGEWVVDTEGSKLSDILSLEGVDVYHTTCNDVREILNTFGIEAAKRFLFREINRVLQAYGIYVNPRHILLLTCKMTQSGELSPCTEKGVSRESGPIAKMSFESPMENAVLASTFGETDDVRSIAGSVMFGKFPKVGTGVVKVKLDEDVLH